MLFKIGIEKPENADTAYSIVIPALCNSNYSAFSASDNFEDIVANAKDAAFNIMEEMATNGDLNLREISELNKIDFTGHPDYKDFKEWAYIDIDLDAVFGKQKRINVSLPDLLIAHIDQVVQAGGRYKDRSDFLSKAALYQLTENRP